MQPPPCFRHRRLLVGLALAVASLGLAFGASLPAITVTWNPNPEPDIAGYELSYGTMSGIHGTTVDVGADTRTQVAGLVEGVTYYFVVAAYNTAGLKSLPSAEIAYQATNPTANQAPDSAIAAPSTDVTITAGETVGFSGGGSDPDGNLPLTYIWSFGIGSGLADSTSRNPGSLRFDSPGIHQVSLTATDSQGLSDPSPATRTITVLNPPPSFEAPDGWISTPSTDETIVAGQSVDFACGGIDSKGNERLRYLWEFGTQSGVADSNVRKPVRRVFNIPGTHVVTLTVIDSNGVSDPSPATRTITVIPPWRVVPRDGWQLHAVIGGQAGGFEASRAFDGNAGTFWHSMEPTPHEIQIDLGGNHELCGFRYLPRQDGSSVGNIGKYRFYASADGVTWGRHVVSGRFPATAGEKQVLFPAKNARFVRLLSLGGQECAVAELNVLESP